ncbi:hypothetical protein KVT40_005332 [Elsinoe batatas]|uniref:Uncharacterized protein n=1 Tax=Elsinoe batatas TaxID=2601811 RepID=A0A8K0PFA6_9PEZI|nr:hypothetical protein KVT40_005332 [Elsinoe batatas]
MYHFVHDLPFTLSISWLNITLNTYNVYRLTFRQHSGVDHKGIALVPAQQEEQHAGRYYHVTGTVGLGMEYEKKPAFKFGSIPELKSKEYRYIIAKTSLELREEIAAGVTPPHDPRVLTDRHPEPTHSPNIAFDQVVYRKLRESRIQHVCDKFRPVLRPAGHGECFYEFPVIGIEPTCFPIHDPRDALVIGQDVVRTQIAVGENDGVAVLRESAS